MGVSPALQFFLILYFLKEVMKTQSILFYSKNRMFQFSAANSEVGVVLSLVFLKWNRIAFRNANIMNTIKSKLTMFHVELWLSLKQITLSVNQISNNQVQYNSNSLNQTLSVHWSLDSIPTIFIALYSTFWLEQ